MPDNEIVQVANAYLPIVPMAQQSQIPLGPTQYLTFTLDESTFAIGILAIKEIIEYGGLTEVPMMPPSIRGVINLRGMVVPVMDLAARFGRAESKVTKRTCIVIVEIPSQHGTQVIGVIVDAVNSVQDLMPTDIEPAPKFGMNVAPAFVVGMGKINGKFVILLNIESIISVNELTEILDASAQEPVAG